MRPLLAAIAATLVVVAGCAAGPSPSATGELASPVETAVATPPPTAAPPTEPPPTSEPTPAATDAGGPTDEPTPDAYWATVRRGLTEAGHLVVTAAGDAPVVVRYLPTASEALVGGDLVSRCIETRSWAGGGGALAPVPGDWRCGSDALVAGFRATGAPIDAWSPDFPAEGSPAERVSVRGDGRWAWTYEVADGLEGPLSATLILDPASGRLTEGVRTDASGTTAWTFDYAGAVGPITAP